MVASMHRHRAAGYVLPALLQADAASGHPATSSVRMDLIWEKETAGFNPAIPTGTRRFPDLVSTTRIHRGPYSWPARTADPPWRSRPGVRHGRTSRPENVTGDDELMSPYEVPENPAGASPSSRQDQQAPPVQSREDTDIAWGEQPEPDENDRLYRDRPPHWDSE